MKPDALFKSVVIFFFLLFALVFCTKDNEEDLNSCQPETSTYTSIKPIFENNCVSCHSVNFSNHEVRLDTYEGVKDAVSKHLLPAIKHEGGVTPMPFGGQKLSDCEVASIESWINRNFPE